MATSRTGYSSHKDWRKRVLARDKAAGITHCPYCHVRLDYENTRQPNSAEPDHKKPWALGGGNTIDNGQTICRRCNQRKGAGKTGKIKGKFIEPPTLRPVDGERW